MGVSQDKKPLSTKRVVFVPCQVYIEGNEQRRGQGPIHYQAWRDWLQQGDVWGKYDVPSKSRKGDFHRVDLSDPQFPKCGCERFFYRCLTEDGYYTGEVCHHIEAVFELHRAKKGRKK